jgi:hypothetical protein
MMGRLIGVICCIFGIFLISLLVVAILIYIFLDADEEKAYNKIDLICTKVQEGNYFSNFFNSFIKYKIGNLKKGIELKDYFIHKNKLKIMREKHLVKIKNNLVNKFELDKFNKNIFQIWDKEMCDEKKDFMDKIDGICKFIDPICNNAEATFQLSKKSMKSCFKLYNLAKIMSSLGSLIEISGKILF